MNAEDYLQAVCFSLVGLAVAAVIAFRLWPYRPLDLGQITS